MEEKTYQTICKLKEKTLLKPKRTKQQICVLNFIDKIQNYKNNWQVLFSRHHNAKLIWFLLQLLFSKIYINSACHKIISDELAAYKLLENKKFVQRRTVICREYPNNKNGNLILLDVHQHLHK